MSAEANATPEHECDSGNFDRSVCPDPCGAMHSYCVQCGERQDPCAHDSNTASEAQRKTPITKSRLRMAAGASVSTFARLDDNQILTRDGFAVFDYRGFAELLGYVVVDDSADPQEEKRD